MSNKTVINFGGIFRRRKYEIYKNLKYNDENDSFRRNHRWFKQKNCMITLFFPAVAPVSNLSCGELSTYFLNLRNHKYIRR